MPAPALRRLVVPLRRRAGIAAGFAALTGALLVVATLLVLDRADPPPLAPPTVSAEVVDRNGDLLRAFLAPDGQWRLKVGLHGIDPDFVRMLLAYEDKRFRSHPGVDPLAVLRAAGQFVANGEIVSGASTITMQLARLLEPRAHRTIGAKLFQMARALQIERRLSKREILTRYLTLAPYGGNIQGVRAASLAWFGKEPRRLSTAEAALLVALPQSPEARRPDRHHAAAVAARNRVLDRMVSAGVLDRREAERARRMPVPRRRHPMPDLAAHAAGAVQRSAPDRQRHELTIDRLLQSRLEGVAREAARRLGPRVSVAMVLADAKTGAILASVGSPDYVDARREGWIDMTRAVRSPGSTLKPFIYGLAFEEGLVAQETLIEDRPADFGGYRPRNFDMAYQGDVSIREALQLSLNVPAVKLLNAVGPARLVAGFRHVGISPDLPPGKPPGLAIGLGGVGLTLENLVQLYTGLANRGVVSRLHVDPDRASAPAGNILEASAAWQVGDILRGVAPPPESRTLAIAYKTGTSYGYRDAWSIGFDGRHVLGVWVGRPDGGSVPGIAGYATAAPILFEAWQRSGIATIPLPDAPVGTRHTAREALPVTLERFSAPGKPTSSAGVAENAPAIVFPPDGAHVALGTSQGGQPEPLVLKLQGGRAPFHWLANGKPFATPVRTRISRWQPDGAGFSRLTVVDAAGRAASVSVFVE